MPLTVSLYREDEVIAALKWCLIRGRTLEAMFWAQECSDSNMIPEALAAAFWVWLFGCGPSNLGWLGRFGTYVKRRHHLNDEDLMGLICSLSGHMRQRPDSSALVLLGLGLSRDSMGPSPPDHVGTQQLPHTLSEFENDKTYGTAVRALLQGKAPLAWHLMRPLWGKNNWHVLHEIVKEEPSLSDSLSWLENARSHMGYAWKDCYTWPIRAVAVAAVSARKPIIMEREANSDYMKQWNEWNALPMRLRRIYTIPTDCLYWHTARGALRVSESTEGELLNGLESAMCGSKIWKMHDKELHESDESREAFYETYFPNDIPDEWSAAARAVSHGRGVIPVGDVRFNVVFERCIDRWFERIPNCIWKGTENALTEFKRRWATPPTSIEQGIYEAYSKESWDFSTSWVSSPRQRRLVVI